MISVRQWMALLALWAVLAVISAHTVRGEEYDDDEIDEEDERLLTRAGRYEEWRRKQEASGFAVPPLHAQEGDASHIQPPLDPKDEPRTTTTRKVDVCIENPLGEACRIQTIARQEQRQREDRLRMDERAQMKERQDFADTAEVLRGGLNRWACAATGVPLYSVRGDRDVLNYFTNLVAQVLTGEGHEPAATLVLKDAMDHQSLLEQQPPTCEHLQRVLDEHPDNDVLAADPAAARREREAQRNSAEGLQARAAREIEFSEARQRDLALERVMVGYYSAMRALLQPKGFWSDDMWPRVEPEMRVVISRWAVARLVYSFEQCVTGAKSAAEAEKLALGCPARETETLLGLIAFVKADGRSQQLEHCVTGGELRRIMDTSREGRLSREVQRLLDACVEGGRLSADPVEFGEVLRRAGRDAEARDLFDTAVNRGKLCNSWQRPEFYHRKDLTAAPLWSAEVAPELQEYLPLLRMRLSEAVASNFSFGDDAYTSTHDVTRLGRWDRASIYGHHQFNEIACDALGRGICDDVASMIRVLRSNHDGYESSCNGSTVVELWRLSGDAFESETAVGPSNIVLQVLVPLRGKRRFIVTVAEEAAFLDPESAQQNPASDQDVLIFDDSFEHRIQTEDAATTTASIDAARIGGALPLWYYRSASDAVNGAGAGAAAAAAIGGKAASDDRKAKAADDDLVLLHIQLCHPELHEKALDKPSGRCAADPY